MKKFFINYCFIPCFMKKWLVFLLLVFSFSPVLAFSTGHVKIVGVQESENGLRGSVADLFVEVEPGSGRVFLDTTPLTEVDTQSSARLGRSVACDLLQVDCSKLDFFYRIVGDSPVIGGPSAGGAMALATLLSLTNTSLSEPIAMTGTINPDGTIGIVGGLRAKAEAVKEVGINSFFIPLFQGEDVNVEGLNIVRVATVEEAFEKVTGKRIVFKELNEEEIVSDEYKSIIKPMAESLLSRLRVLVSELESEISDSSPYFVELRGYLNASRQSLISAEELFDEGDYYVSASKAVQGLINARQGLVVVGYDVSVNKSKYVEDYVDFVSSLNFPNLSGVVFDNVHDLELVIIGLDRFYESRELLNKSRELLLSDPFQAVLVAGLAHERFFTSLTWFNSTNFLDGNESFKFDESVLKGLAGDVLERASTLVTYSNTIVELPFLSNSLSGARDDFFNGKYARALFKGLSIIGDANLVMESRALSDDNLRELYQIKLVNVRKLISRSVNKGSVPLLSISYYTFAKSFFSENDTVSALRYLNYAGTFSSLSLDAWSVISGEQTMGFVQPSVVSNSFSLDFSVSDRDLFFFLLGVFFMFLLKFFV